MRAIRTAGGALTPARFARSRSIGARAALRTGTAVLAGALMIASGDALAQSTVSVPADTITRTTTYEYHADGRVKTEVLEPGGSASVKLTSTLNLLPNNVRESVSTGWNGLAEVNRVTRVDYGADGRFPRKTTNAAGHLEERQFDARFGLPITLVDVNGVVTRIDYDSFGRKKLERRGFADLATSNFVDQTGWTYERCADLAGGCAAVEGSAAVTVVTTSVSSAAGAKLAPSTKTYLDRLGREIRTELEAIKNGALTAVLTDRVYDALGNVQKVSLPYFRGDAVYWTLFEYDILGRNTREQAPNGVVTQTVRTSLAVTVTVTPTSGTAIAKTSRSDSLGLLAEVIDANGRSTAFVHDAQGNRTHVIDPYGNTVQVGYDARGRRTSLKDPDLGPTAATVPNAFGDVVSETDGLGRTTTREYDLLGRLQKVTAPDLVTSYEYDAGVKALGKLSRIYTTNGYCRTHVYDSLLGRPTATTVGMGGISPCSAPTAAAFTATTGYDDAGRASTLTYPTGFKTKNVYDASLGLLQQVKGYTGDVDGPVHWEWQESDALGRVVKFKTGKVQTLKTYAADTTWLREVMSGSAGNAAMADVQRSAYEYNSLGELVTRSDKFQMPLLVEESRHDVLGRLFEYWRVDSVSGSEVSGSRVTLTYDATGNIKTKSDVGVYYYNAPGAGSVRPHAVAEIRGALNASFKYEAGTGNMQSGAGRAYQFDSRDLVTEVGGASACHRFVYQGEGLRMQQSVYGTSCTGAQESGLVSRTLYMHPDAANGLMFEQELRGARNLYKHYINAGGSVVGVVLAEQASVTSNAIGTPSYFHYDHLGSVVAISDGNGAVTERRSYDPWGRPRASDGGATAGELPGGLSAGTDRGFTMHEHLEGLNLIHMNGRVYDFNVGRFVSPDPQVPNPDELQSYNRFSYVMNRPLGSADPTGFIDVPFVGNGIKFSLSDPSFTTQTWGGAGSYSLGLGSSNWLAVGGSTNGFAGASQFQPLVAYNYSFDYSMTAAATETSSRPAGVMSLILRANQLPSLRDVTRADIFAVRRELEAAFREEADPRVRNYLVGASVSLAQAGGQSHLLSPDEVMSGPGLMGAAIGAGTFGGGPGNGGLAKSGQSLSAAGSAGRSTHHSVSTGVPSTPVGRTGSWQDTSQFTGNTVRANRELNVAGARAGAPPVNRPAFIGGREYSGHALDRMQQRGYVPSVVEDAIGRGTRTPSYGGASSYYSPTNNLTVIVNDATGRVVTVRGGP